MAYIVMAHELIAMYSHGYIGRNYTGHKYIGHNYTAHTYIGHDNISHKYT